MSSLKFSEKTFDLTWKKYTSNDVKQVLTKERLDEIDLKVLLSGAATPFLEEMAEKARDLTLRYFGRSISIYTPLYLANYCVNHCLYCGYNHANNLKREALNEEQIIQEIKKRADDGHRTILLLTGEDRIHSSVQYIGRAVELCKGFFDSINIEVYPLETSEYKEIVDKGASGLTMYQETYNKEIYHAVHPKGPKHNYEYRLDAPQRGIEAGMRRIGIGALLGLSNPREDAFMSAMHAKWLSDTYPGIEISLSLPRIRPCVGGYDHLFLVEDKYWLQIFLAYRLFLPHVGLNVSTRESAAMRDHLVGIGVTALSAGVKTSVGEDEDTAQFDINDERGVKDMVTMLKSKGYQGIFKDWFGGQV